VTAGRALAAPPPLTGQPDALPADHSGRDGHIERARAVDPLDGDRAADSVVGLLHRQRDLCLLVGTGDWPPTPPASPEQPAQQIVEVDAEVAGVAGGVHGPPAAGPAPRARPGPGPGPCAAPGIRVHVLGHLPEVRAE